MKKISSWYALWDDICMKKQGADPPACPEGGCWRCPIAAKLNYQDKMISLRYGPEDGPAFPRETEGVRKAVIQLKRNGGRQQPAHQVSGAD